MLQWADQKGKAPPTHHPRKPASRPPQCAALQRGEAQVQHKTTWKNPAPRHQRSHSHKPLRDIQPWITSEPGELSERTERRKWTDSSSSELALLTQHSDYQTIATHPNNRLNPATRTAALHISLVYPFFFFFFWTCTYHYKTWRGKKTQKVVKRIEEIFIYIYTYI